MGNSHIPSTLTEATYRAGISELVRRDPALAGVLSRWGSPPFWTQEPGFPGLVIAILAQQVSLESARAAFGRLEQALNSVDPADFLTLDDRALKGIGFSRQKASYVRGIAQGLLDGEIALNALEWMEDEDVRQYLMQIRGIGAWTADTYLLFSLRRPDAWPSGDLALAKAIQELRGWVNMPEWEEVDRIAAGWRPWRGVAARLLWHHYLSERGRSAW